MALKVVKGKPPTSRYGMVFSDSQSALQSISNTRKSAPDSDLY